MNKAKLAEQQTHRDQEFTARGGTRGKIRSAMYMCTTKCLCLTSASQERVSISSLLISGQEDKGYYYKKKKKKCYYKRNT